MMELTSQSVPAACTLDAVNQLYKIVKNFPTETRTLKYE
jgi:hypothetical protein